MWQRLALDSSEKVLHLYHLAWIRSTLGKVWPWILTMSHLEYFQGLTFKLVLTLNIDNILPWLLIRFNYETSFKPWCSNGYKQGLTLNIIDKVLPRIIVLMDHTRDFVLRPLHRSMFLVNQNIQLIALSVIFEQL